jgi:hypothetical protein
MRVGYRMRSGADCTEQAMEDREALGGPGPPPRAPVAIPHGPRGPVWRSTIRVAGTRVNCVARGHSGGLRRWVRHGQATQGRWGPAPA